MLFPPSPSFNCSTSQQPQVSLTFEAGWVASLPLVAWLAFWSFPTAVWHIFACGCWRHRILTGDFMAVPTPSPPSLAHCNRFKGRNIGESLLPSRPSLASMLVLITSMYLRGVAGLLQQYDQGKPLLLVPDGDLLATFRSMLSNRSMPRLKLPRSRVMMIRTWVPRGQLCKTTF